MKNRTTGLLMILCAAGIWAGAVYADLKKGNYAPAASSGMPQSAPAAQMPDANYEVSSYPVPSLDLAPGEGRAEVQIYCNTCHSPRYITMQPPLPAATWEAEVNKMNKAMGAGIPEDAAKKIISYLQAHYTPETRKP